MSYLNPLRLHFAGRFQAAISTVNNRSINFNNETFEPQYQERGSRGGFNPKGEGDWRLIGCEVTTAWMSDGSPVNGSDPILGDLIADSDRQVAAKLVDLDPQQQLVSQIWGLEVRICDTKGKTLLRGEYEPVGFMDIWTRSGGGSTGASAMYQSVLSNLEWGEIEDSPFLQELRASATDGLLSIKFNVDRFNTAYQSPEFMRGRIVGTIGLATANEPRHFALGRHFMTTDLETGFFVPAGQINFCVAAVNEDAGKIYLDLGNALPMESDGNPKDLGRLSLFGGNQEELLIGDIAYTEPDWYEQTAGVVELPKDRTLTEQELQAIGQNPLALRGEQPDQLFITEPSSGLYVRADQYVFRLNPGENADVKLFATKWGERYPGAQILSSFDPQELLSIPSNGIQFPPRVVTDQNGVATLSILANDPGNPRGYIDGQVYAVQSVLEETSKTDYPFNPWEFISLLVWDTFQADEPPTWYGSMQPIFQQYANLYPVMKQFLDMGDYDSVSANRGLLLLAFGLEVKNPNSMPVTRDLSGTKREAILRWLKEVDPDGKPLKGTPRPAVAKMAPASSAPAATAEAIAEEPPQLYEDGKASAVRRRLGRRHSRP